METSFGSTTAKNEVRKMTDNTSLEFELNLKHAIAGVFLLGS